MSVNSTLINTDRKCENGDIDDIHNSERKICHLTLTTTGGDITSYNNFGWNNSDKEDFVYVLLDS